MPLIDSLTKEMQSSLKERLLHKLRIEREKRKQQTDSKIFRIDVFNERIGIYDKEKSMSLRFVNIFRLSRRIISVIINRLNRYYSSTWYETNL